MQTAKAMGSIPSHTDVFVHSGVVSRVEGHSVTVTLDQNVHCESCRAKGACGVSDGAAKQIQIDDPTKTYTRDQPVRVVLKKGLGHKAVAWAYVFPFLLMTGTLLLGSALFEEWLAGVLSLAVLVPYFTGVYALKGYFRKTFKASLQSL